MNISIICIPYQIDVTRWGVALGPQAFLDHGLIQLLEAKGHTVSNPTWIELPKSERTRDSITNLGNIAKRSSAAVCEALTQKDAFVLVLAGDCTHAVGAIGGLAQAKGSPGVVWFDAHGDLNTWETTTSGFLGGLPYAVALGWDLDDWRLAAGLEQPVRPEAAALIGASDLDLAEIEALELHPILRMDAVEMEQPGVAKRLQAALRPRATEAKAWYLHIDLDVAGPEENPGNLTPAPHWPPRQHIIEAARTTAHTVPVKVASLAVYNPAGDANGRGARFGLDMAMAILDGVASRTSD
ncbi:MAG TPA: arginase family protein [Ktedonobacteraceae bacterium]|nr:arginase family protein [Ktedonobacteraceae bacterium]